MMIFLICVKELCVFVCGSQPEGRRHSVSVCVRLLSKNGSRSVPGAPEPIFVIREPSLCVCVCACACACVCVCVESSSEEISWYYADTLNTQEKATAANRHSTHGFILQDVIPPPHTHTHRHTHTHTEARTHIHYFTVIVI